MTFIIQHFLGLAGMPRRVYTYPDLPGWAWMNMLSTVGAFFMAAASLIFVWNLIVSLLIGGQGRRQSVARLDSRMGDHVRRRRMRISITCRRFAAAARFGMSRIPTVLIRSWAAEKISTSSEPEKNKTSVVPFIMSETGFFARPHPRLSLLQRHAAGRTESA